MVTLLGTLMAPGLAAELCLDVQYRFVDRGGARLETTLNPHPQFTFTGLPIKVCKQRLADEGLCVEELRFAKWGLSGFAASVLRNIVC